AVRVAEGVGARGEPRLAELDRGRVAREAHGGDERVLVLALDERHDDAGARPLDLEPRGRERGREPRGSGLLEDDLRRRLDVDDGDLEGEGGLLCGRGGDESQGTEKPGGRREVAGRFRQRAQYSEELLVIAAADRRGQGVELGALVLGQANLGGGDV